MPAASITLSVALDHQGHTWQAGEWGARDLGKDESQYLFMFKFALLLEPSPGPEFFGEEESSGAAWRFLLAVVRGPYVVLG